MVVIAKCLTSVVQFLSDSGAAYKCYRRVIIAGRLFKPACDRQTDKRTDGRMDRQVDTSNFVTAQSALSVKSNTAYTLRRQSATVELLVLVDRAETRLMGLQFTRRLMYESVEQKYTDCMVFSCVRLSIRIKQ